MSDIMGNQRFSIAPAKAVADKELSDSAYRTLAALGIFGDKNGWCFPKLQTIGDILGKSKQAVSRDIQILQAKGYLEIHPRYDKESGARRSNLIRIRFDYQELPDELDPVNCDDTPPSTPVVDTPSTSGVDVNAPINAPINEGITSKEKGKTRQSSIKNIRGIEAAIIMGRAVSPDDLFPENSSAQAVIEGLSHLNPNWPKYGENREWDRVARLIVDAVQKGTGTVEGFVKWVNRQKDRPQRIQWYGRKPSNVWEDWPLAFEQEPEERHYPTVQELEEKGML